MRGCRHSGVRVIVPPRCASSPTRITCRYVRPIRTPHPPPLMEGEALASRLLELGPVGARFLGPVIIEVPHFASLRGKQREIVVLRSDNGETWKEHTLEANEEAIQDVLNHSFDGEELSQIEDLHTSRITRILTNDFPHYFAVVSRIRQEVHAIGPDGGTVSSSAVPLVQAVFPSNALTKKIRVGLQAQAIESELVSKMLGHSVAVSPIVTVEPRRRKFHKAITLSMPAPRAHSQGMINQYSGSAPTLRLLCSITGGQNKAVWEDVTGSTPLSFVKDCVSFTTTVSARFWLLDCRNVSDAAKMATDLYTQAAHVPFMAKFVVFAKRISQLESRIRVFCMTDDKEDKTLEHQEHFVEIAKSRDIEVLEHKSIFMEFAGNLVPVLQSGDQPQLGFKAFKENRLAFTMRLKDPDEEPVGRIVFMSDSKVAKGEPTQTPLCTLNLVLPKDILPDRDSQSDLLSLDADYSFLQHGISKPDAIHRADFKLSDICNLLNEDWVKLASELDIPPSDIALIREEYPNNEPQQATVMFRLWLRQKANKATGNQLELALKKIGRQDIVSKCICNVELVTDDMEKALAKVHLDQSGFDALREELGPSRDTSLGRDHKKSFKGSDDEVDKSDKSNDFQNQNSTLNDTSEPLISDDYSSFKKTIQTTENQLDNRTAFPNANDEMMHKVTHQLKNLQSTPKLTVPTNSNTPPSSPADRFDREANLLNLEKGFNEDVPTKSEDPIAVLKKNVSDTLTFLHQERNDFLPEEDIIIPGRKEDHIAHAIDLDCINLKQKKNDDAVLKNAVESEVDDVIRTAESVVNELKLPPRQEDAIEDSLEDSLDNLESLKDDSVSNSQAKSEEAFKFLENEVCTPLTPLKESWGDSACEPTNKSVSFGDESSKNKSSIPVVAKGNKRIEYEKDIDLLFSYDGSGSPPDGDDLLSRIPVCAKGGKVKTIKKHSKDPLKEFVKLSQDVNWDDNDDEMIGDPIVKTTVTRITSETGTPEKNNSKSKIPVLHTETLSPTEITERYDVKSKIPVLRTETTRIASPEVTTTYVERTIVSPTVETTVVSPGSRVSTKSSTLDSDSDEDRSRSPPLKGILKKTNVRATVGSSSGSDVALHEEGAELSESETEDFYQQDQPHYTETTTEEIDPVTGAKVTRTVKTVSQTITSPGGRNQGALRQSMQDALDQFITEERNPQ